MAKKQQGDGFWPRMIVTMLLIIWGGFLLGSWLGNSVIDKYLQQDDYSEAKLPEATRKPWLNKDNNLQKEIEGQSETATKEAELLTVPPIESKQIGDNSGSNGSAVSSDSSSLEVGSAQSAGPSTAGEAAPASSDSASATADNSGNNFTLSFASFTEKANAEALVERLKEANFKAVITTIPVEKGVVYKVSSEPLASQAEAEEQIKILSGKGFDPYTDASK